MNFKPFTQYLKKEHIGHCIYCGKPMLVKNFHNEFGLKGFQWICSTCNKTKLHQIGNQILTQAIISVGNKHGKSPQQSLSDYKELHENRWWNKK